MTIICLSFISLDVKAEEVDFYEAEKIDNIYTKVLIQKKLIFKNQDSLEENQIIKLHIV